MRFEQLISKVRQAEDAVEMQERRVVVQLQQLKGTWREAWTPGRIIIAGLVSGFVIGRAEPMRAIGKSGGLMQMVSMLSGLFAGGSAQVAATEAGQAAEHAEHAAQAANPEAVDPAVAEAEELARVEARLQAARAAAIDPIER
jgi:hypothetical protein